MFMETNINLLVLDRFRYIERMLRVAAVPYAGELADSAGAEQDQGKAKSGPAFCVLKRDSVLPFLLCKKDGVKQKEIADEIRVSPSTLSEMINRLVDDGYVMRKADAGDRRVKKLCLTDEGRDRAEYMLSQMTILLDRLFVNLSDEEKKELIRLLDKLSGNDPAKYHEDDSLCGQQSE